MKRKLAVVILLTVLAILAIPAVAVFFGRRIYGERVARGDRVRVRGPTEERPVRQRSPAEERPTEERPVRPRSPTEERPVRPRSPTDERPVRPRSPKGRRSPRSPKGQWSPRSPRSPKGPRSPSLDRAQSAQSAVWRGTMPTVSRCGPKTRLSRGQLGPYTHVGILTVPETVGAVGAGAGTVGPVSLYGRPTHRGADRWNYYAISNQHVPQKLPVFMNNTDCAKLKGCPEAFDGDVIDVRGYGRASVTLYTREDADLF